MSGKNLTTTSKDYLVFLKEIKDKITKARITAYKSLNKELIKLYWDIGRSIVEKQEEYGWGKGIVARLSDDLRKEFPGAKGYSAQNLWYMRQFYLEYKDVPNLQQLVGEIPWGQNLVILSRVKNVKDREFYIKSTIQFGWSRDVLIHQIEAEAHKQATIKKVHNFPKALPAYLSEQADLALKDTYTLDFLDIEKPLLEREMERKLLENLKTFLVELGLGFCFMGNQYKIKLNEKEYYIDLLFYHRFLHCLVAIDLKIGEFKPEYAGKMNFYLNLLDEKVKLPEENPSIGIIICKDRDQLEVEYTLKGISKPIGVSKYKIIKKLPSHLQNKLPTQKDIEKGLKE
jgi:predicted nuclease of restriction endonuclease-like (RecB) superfamily